MGNQGKQKLLWGILLFSMLQNIAPAQVNPHDSLAVDSFLRWIEPRIENFDAPMDIYRKCHEGLVLARQNGDPDLLAYAYGHLAEWHNFHYNFFPGTDSSLYYDYQALEQYRLLGDSFHVAQFYTFLTTDAQRLDSMKLAEQYALEAIKAFDRIGDLDWMAVSYLQMSEVYRALKDTSASVTYADKGLAAIEASGDDYFLAYGLSAASEAYLLAENYDRVIEMSTRSIELYKAGIGDIDILPQLNAYRARGKALLKTGKLEAALRDQRYAADQALAQMEEEVAVEYVLPLGDIYQARGEYRPAIQHYLKSAELAQVYDQKKELILAYLGLINCYEAIGEPENAHRYLDLYQELELAELRKQINSLQSELLIRYQTEEKDEQIAQQAVALSQQKRIQYLAFTVGALLLVILVGVYRNFLQKRRQGRQLQDLNANLQIQNERNELLLKEIHHRVKNNLTVVSGLLELQSAYLEDSGMHLAMRESQNRVMSMGIIHQKLYQRDKLTAIEMKDYFRSLSEVILDAFGDQDRIELQYSMEEIELNIDAAIPVGLITNELLTNALKYAFPDGRAGTIAVSLQYVAEDILELRVADDGVGKAVNGKGRSGFGSQLVTLLTRQLKGELREEGENGTTVSIRFRKPKTSST